MIVTLATAILSSMATVMVMAMFVVWTAAAFLFLVLFLLLFQFLQLHRVLYNGLECHLLALLDHQQWILSDLCLDIALVVCIWVGQRESVFLCLCSCLLLGWLVMRPLRYATVPTYNLLSLLCTQQFIDVLLSQQKLFHVVFRRSIQVGIRRRIHPV